MCTKKKYILSTYPVAIESREHNRFIESSLSPCWLLNIINLKIKKGDLQGKTVLQYVKLQPNEVPLLDNWPENSMADISGFHSKHEIVVSHVKTINALWVLTF